MSRKRTENQLDFEADFTTTGPVRQSVSIRAKASRKRSSARRKQRSAEAKTPKVSGMHKRTNKRINW